MNAYARSRHKNVADLAKLTGQALEDELYRRVAESTRSHRRHCKDLARELGIPAGHVEAMVNRATERESWRIAGMEPPRPGAVIWTYTGKAEHHLGWHAQIRTAEGEARPLSPEEVRTEIHHRIDQRRGAAIAHERPYDRKPEAATSGKGAEELTEEWTARHPLIEAQATGAEIRRCVICKMPLPAEMKVTAKTCSDRHRRLLHRLHQGDETVHEAIRMATNPPPCEGCGKPLFDMRAGTKVHNDHCRRLRKERRKADTTKDKADNNLISNGATESQRVELNMEFVEKKLQANKALHEVAVKALRDDEGDES